MTRPNLNFKERLKKALEINNMTQQELADKTGIPKSSISQYVRGYAAPKSDRIYLLAKALHVEEAWLMGYEVPLSEENTSYYYDPEVAEIADEIHKRPELKVLFDASRKVSKEDLQYVNDLLQRLKK